MPLAPNRRAAKQARASRGTRACVFASSRAYTCVCISSCGGPTPPSTLHRHTHTHTARRVQGRRLHPLVHAKRRRYSPRRRSPSPTHRPTTQSPRPPGYAPPPAHRQQHTRVTRKALGPHTHTRTHIHIHTHARTHAHTHAHTGARLDHAGSPC